MDIARGIDIRSFLFSARGRLVPSYGYATAQVEECWPCFEQVFLTNIAYNGRDHSDCYTLFRGIDSTHNSRKKQTIPGVDVLGKAIEAPTAIEKECCITRWWLIDQPVCILQSATV